MANIPRSDLRSTGSQNSAGFQPSSTQRSFMTQSPGLNVSRTDQAGTARRTVHENIRPLTGTQNSNVRRLNVKDARTRIMQQNMRTKKRDRSRTHDFLLGFGVGLAIFGTAAVFVCKALVDIFL